MKKSFEPFVVRYVKFTTLKLVDHNGEYHPSIHIRDAKDLATGADLDLVCFSLPVNDKLALCKIIDYGKWKYDNDKHKKKQQKNSKKTTKEIRLSPQIEIHDIEHKLKQANEFLDNGDDVVLFMKLKGRQMAHFDEAESKMQEILEMFDAGKEINRRKTKSTLVVRLVKK